MPFVKPSIGVSRLAGAAYKSFTHGSAGQAVIAASQTSYASQNHRHTPAAALLERFGPKSGNAQLHNVVHIVHSNSSNAPARLDTSQQTPDLAQYHDAWLKHQKAEELRDWNQSQLPKKLGYKVTVSAESKDSRDEDGVVVEVVQDAESLPERASLKRAYTTSAVDNFSKAIGDEKAEAIALAQVNEAIAEEISRSKQEAEAAAGTGRVLVDEDAASEKTVTPSTLFSQDSTSPQSAQTSTFAESNVTAAIPVSEVDAYAEQLDELVRSQQFAKIPGAFEGMLLSGISQPAPLAYRALMTSAIKLTHGKHQKVPRALEVYSDMHRRRVLPDAETYIALVNLLAGQALESASTKAALEEKRTRYAGLNAETSFLFEADQLEYALISEDQSLTYSLAVFNTASLTTFSSQSYALMIAACAKHGRIPDMLRLYEHMESKELVPQASIFPVMINAFASVGDLRNAVECYDEYKELAIANDAGKIDISRLDNEVYAALIKAYASCGHLAGGQRFFGQIESEQPDGLKRAAVHDTVVLEAFLPLALQAGDIVKAFNLSDGLSATALPRALNIISVRTADANNVTASIKAFNTLAATEADLAPSAVAVLAMHLRNANVEAAEPYWRVLESSTASLSFIDPSVMRTVALIRLGDSARGVRDSRHMLNRIRDVAGSQVAHQEVFDRVEQAVELFAGFVSNSGKPVPIQTSIELLRMMADNGSLVDTVAEQIVASFGPEQIAQLPPADIGLLAKVQSRMILDESAPEIAGPARFACLLDNIVSRNILPDVSTEDLVEKTLINIDRSDLSRLWNNYRYPVAPQLSPIYPQPTQFLPLSQPSFTLVQPTFDDSFDPYAGRTDNKGSVAITDLLEKSHGKSANHLNDALTRFRNIRRAGRHPRFFAYAKLITAAAKENQLNLSHEILEMAKQDLPYNAQHRVVRYGWVTILDSMLAACLTVGRRDLASKYHQDLLDMGAAPSANTYGLYITTLKDNTKTFDEATEAVKIFMRAKAEGVEPSSFLYNALIGKLGKARRIDDCLFYFTEMQSLAIKPTSVTYGTIVNALCRVSDEKFAEEIFEEMESCPNYKARPAPYHSLMQYFLTTKRDRSKVLSYYERMRARGIQPTMHTYKLLIDTHATLEPVNMDAAEEVIAQMRASGEQPEAVHFASLIHAKGCVQRDLSGARALFDTVISDPRIRPQACLYQALVESFVANHHVADTDALLADMAGRRVEMTPYIANALIHGWASEKDIVRAQRAFDGVRVADREPSTYEAMVRAYLVVEDREGAKGVVREASGRGYPAAVAGKIAELVGGGRV